MAAYKTWCRSSKIQVRFKRSKDSTVDSWTCQRWSLELSACSRKSSTNAGNRLKMMATKKISIWIIRPMQLVKFRSKFLSMIEISSNRTSSIRCTSQWHSSKAPRLSLRSKTFSTISLRQIMVRMVNGLSVSKVSNNALKAKTLVFNSLVSDVCANSVDHITTTLPRIKRSCGSLPKDSCHSLSKCSKMWALTIIIHSKWTWWLSSWRFSTWWIIQPLLQIFSSLERFVHGSNSSFKYWMLSKVLTVNSLSGLMTKIKSKSWTKTAGGNWRVSVLRTLWSCIKSTLWTTWAPDHRPNRDAKRRLFKCLTRSTNHSSWSKSTSLMSSTMNI